jgi:hypothetical protein
LKKAGIAPAFLTLILLAHDACLAGEALTFRRTEETAPTEHFQPKSRKSLRFS